MVALDDFHFECSITYSAPEATRFCRRRIRAHYDKSLQGPSVRKSAPGQMDGVERGFVRESALLLHTRARRAPIEWRRRRPPCPSPASSAERARPRWAACGWRLRKGRTSAGGREKGPFAEWNGRIPLSEKNARSFSRSLWHSMRVRGLMVSPPPLPTTFAAAHSLPPSCRSTASAICTVLRASRDARLLSVHSTESDVTKWGRCWR